MHDNADYVKRPDPRAVSATQREAIAGVFDAIPQPVWPYDAGAASTGWDMAMTAAEDAVLAVVAGLVDEARRDERERIKAGVEALREAALTYGKPGRDRKVQLVAFENVLVVIEGSEAT